MSNFISDKRDLSARMARNLKLPLVLTLLPLLHGCAADAYMPGAFDSADIEVVLNPVQVFDGAGSASLDFGDQPQMLGYVSAVAASGGYLFLIDSTTSSLLRIDSVSGEMLLLRALRDATTPGVYVRPDLVVYVVDRQNRAIIELDESGYERHVFREPGLVAMPVDVVMADWGSSLIVADEMTQRLVMFESFSTLTGFLPHALAPVRVAGSIAAIAASEGSVFVLDSAAREVTQLDLEGRLVATYGEDTLMSPVAIAVDRCERIFVADGHPDGLFVTSQEFYGTSSRAALPREIVSTVTDLWIDGNDLYVAAGVSGVWMLSIEPGCFAR